MGGLRAPSPGGNFEIYDVFQGKLPEILQHLTTRRAMSVNELSSTSQTKVPTQGDTSAAVVAIA